MDSFLRIHSGYRRITGGDVLGHPATDDSGLVLRAFDAKRSDDTYRTRRPIVDLERFRAAQGNLRD